MNALGLTFNTHSKIFTYFFVFKAFLVKFTLTRHLDDKAQSKTKVVGKAN